MLECGLSCCGRAAAAPAAVAVAVAGAVVIVLKVPPAAIRPYDRLRATPSKAFVAHIWILVGSGPWPQISGPFGP